MAAHDRDQAAGRLRLEFIIGRRPGKSVDAGTGPRQGHTRAVPRNSKPVVGPWIRGHLASFLAPKMRTPFARRFLVPIVTPLHLWLFRVSRGQFHLSAVVIPSLVLESKGARSGLIRQSPLMYWPEPDGTYLVSGSNWG